MSYHCAMIDRTTVPSRNEGPRMNHRAIPRPRLAALALVAALLVATVAQAQISYPRLGLSASKDAYVDTMTSEAGQPFTLHVIATGVDGLLPLPFEMATFDWAVFAVCCGGAAGMLGYELCADLDHAGHPLVSVTSSAETCLDRDVIYLASVTFFLEGEGPGDYLMVAGATGPAYDCDGGNHLLMDLAVTVTLTGDVTPTDDPTWGQVKALYR